MKLRQALVPKALDATTRAGQADVFLEWFFFWQPENQDDLWEEGFRFGAVVIKAHPDHLPAGYKGKGHLADRVIKSLDQLRTPPTLSVSRRQGPRTARLLPAPPIARRAHRLTSRGGGAMRPSLIHWATRNCSNLSGSFGSSRCASLNDSIAPARSPRSCRASPRL